MGTDVVEIMIGVELSWVMFMMNIEHTFLLLLLVSRKTRSIFSASAESGRATELKLAQIPMDRPYQCAGRPHLTALGSGGRWTRTIAQKPCVYHATTESESINRGHRRIAHPDIERSGD
jgi:hypothetical protein